MIDLLADALSLETALISGLSALTAAVGYLFSYIIKSVSLLREENKECSQDREQLWAKVAELSAQKSCSSDCCKPKQ